MDGSVARPRPFLAMGIRLVTAFVFATMGMLVKLASNNGVHLVEMIFWRQAVTLILILVGFAALGRLASLKTQRLRGHGLRAILGGVGMFFTYGAVVVLPLAEAATLSYTAPFFAVVIAVTMFGEKVGIYRSAAVIVGFAGVLVIMQPGQGTADVTIWGVCVALIAAALVALISYQVQDLNKTENPWTIVFWFTALTAPLLLVMLPFFASMHEVDVWGIILAMALCGALAQILLTASLRFGSAGMVLLMDYTSLLWATWYGFSVFDREPSSNLWVGAPLIIAAGLLIAWRERMLTRAPQNDKTA